MPAGSAVGSEPRPSAPGPRHGAPFRARNAPAARHFAPICARRAPFCALESARGGVETAPPAAVTLHLQVDDADVWFQRAVSAGATVRMTLADQFWGDRYGQITDPFGHHWSIGGPKKG